MADIFISYASADRPKAKALAEVLSLLGWSVWWDREIPLGVSFDEIIEKALADAHCAIVLWSAVSVGRDWVRNEADESKRRNILVPVYLEDVQAPLAFRRINGANLSDWKPGQPHAEFDRLIQHVKRLTGERVMTATPTLESSRRFRWFRFAIIPGKFRFAIIVSTAVAAFGVAFLLYPNRKPSSTTVANNSPPATNSPEGTDDIERALRNLTQLGGASNLLTTGFHIPELGVRLAFISHEQSASIGIPAGAVVIEVDSDRPAGRSGVHAAL